MLWVFYRQALMFPQAHIPQILFNLRNALAVWGQNSTQYQASAGIAAAYLESLKIAHNDGPFTADVREIQQALQSVSLQEDPNEIVTQK